MKNKGTIKETAAALSSVMVQSSRNTEPCIGLLKLTTKKKRCRDKHGSLTTDQVVGRFTKRYNAEKIDKFKTCVFTNHLVTFNETFSEFGENGKDTAVVWHEAWFG